MALYASSCNNDNNNNNCNNNNNNTTKTMIQQHTLALIKYKIDPHGIIEQIEYSRNGFNNLKVNIGACFLQMMSFFLPIKLKKLKEI